MNSIKLKSMTILNDEKSIQNQNYVIVISWLGYWNSYLKLYY